VAANYLKDEWLELELSEIEGRLFKDEQPLYFREVYLAVRDELYRLINQHRLVNQPQFSQERNHELATFRRSI
jgi:hypothetical protein